MFSEVPSSDLPPGIDHLLNKTKGGLFFKVGSGFLAPILAKLTFHWTKDISTAAISNKQLFWNPDFFMKLSKEQRITVLAHELWHNAYMHGSRIGDMRCPDIWNEAGDHVINLMLEAHGYVFGDLPCLKDPQFRNMSTDDVYDILEQQQGKPMNMGGFLAQPGNGPPPPPGQGNDPSGGLDPLGKDVIPVSKEDVVQAVSDVIAALAAANIGGLEPGTIPGEISLTIDQFLNPKLPWETIFFNFFNALTTEEYSFTRPNRRYHDPMIPGITGRNGLEHLIYYLDISGSITDDQILRFNSEVKFIQEELKPERLTLVTFDEEIHDIYEFERDDPFEKIVVVGRGGTDLEDVFDHLKKNAPTAAIIFTDLEVGIPPNPGVPIIWVCIDNDRKTVPYGEMIHLSA
jgi:predicted metal-dependent peptidase